MRTLASLIVCLLLGAAAALPAEAQSGPAGSVDLRTRLPIAGAPARRTLSQKLGDQLSILDFGAACDGVTDDSNAVVAAGQSGRRVMVPGGLTCYAPGVLQSSLVGNFAGDGHIVTSVGGTPGTGPFTPRGPAYSAVRTPPNPQAWDQVNSAQDNCSGGFPCWAKFDYSHTLSAEEFHISGAATLGQPLHGYEGMPGTNAHTLLIDNNSGWNQSHDSNDGRTGASAYSVVLQQNGGGDFGIFGGQLLCGGHVGPGDGNTSPGPNGIINGYTDWLAVPNCGFQGGQLSALAPGQFMQMQEFHFTDFGNDVSAIGSVMGYNRTATTAKINNRWVNELATCNLFRAPDAIPCDAAYVIGGQWFIGMDFVGAPNIQSFGATIAQQAGQKITLNGTQTDPTGEGNPSLTNLGGDWLSDDGYSVILAHNGGTALRIANPASPVDWWVLGGAAAGGTVSQHAQGADAAIGALMGDKGGAGVVLESNGVNALRVAGPANPIGYLNVETAAAGSPMVIADYSGGNQDMALAAAGTGLVRIAGTAPTAGDNSSAVATTGMVQAVAQATASTDQAAAQTAATAAAKGAVFAMASNRFKLLNVGGGINGPLPVPAGVIDQMIVEIVPNAPTIPNMALTMPPSAAIPDGFIVHFICTGTITSFIVAGNTGQTVLGAPGTITTATPVAFMWDSALSEWVRF